MKTRKQDIKRTPAISFPVLVLSFAGSFLTCFGILINTGVFDGTPYDRIQVWYAAVFLGTVGMIATIASYGGDSPIKDFDFRFDQGHVWVYPILVKTPSLPRLVLSVIPPKVVDSDGSQKLPPSQREVQRQQEQLVRRIADTESRLIWIKHLPTYAEYVGIVTQVLAGTKDLATPGMVPRDQVPAKKAAILALLEREAQLHATPPIQRAISKVRHLEETL